MIGKIFKILNKRFPQNYILKNPFYGVLMLFVFCFVFINIYKPLKVHEGQFLSFTATIAVYCSVFALTVFVVIKILKQVDYFSNQNEWTFIKELSSIVLILLMMGIATYFSGFFIEIPTSRWNLGTFINSCLIAFLIGIIPFAFFTLSNLRHLFATDISQLYETNSIPGSAPVQREEIIQIGSRLKKEELSFYPSDFIYAESDGNYVVFYLKTEQQVRKEIIRNSISEIEQQLSPIPYFMRTHRAFIVNVKKVISKKGNTLGYRLKLSDSTSEIPVSRQNIPTFDKVLKQYCFPSVTKNNHS